MSQPDGIAALYNTLLGVNEQAYGIGHYEIAYHALAGALHAAQDLESMERLVVVERLADVQMRQIDIHDPEHRIGKHSAAFRNNRSIYENLVLQAHSMQVRLRGQQAGQAKLE